MILACILLSYWSLKPAMLIFGVIYLFLFFQPVPMTH